MSAATDAIDQLIDHFITGDLPFMAFWRAFTDLYHDSGLSDSESDYYEPVYDVVYMGGGQDTSLEDAAVGVLSDDEVKSQLREFRTRRS
jgi:hypothetical protein